MSSTMTSNTKKRCDDWAFDIATQFDSSDDSCSDFESDDRKLATANTGLLTDDLDLSKREEHVVYKPNPFSIAKINAIYRPTSTVNDSVPSPLPAQPMRPANKSKPTKTRPTKRSCTDSGQITIMEGFKTQALKKPITNASQLPVPLWPTTNPISSHSNPTVNKPESLIPDIFASSTLPTAIISAAVTSPCSLSTAMAPNTSDVLSTSSRLPGLPEYAHISPQKTSQHRNAQTLSQSHDFSPAQLLLCNQRKPTDSHGPIFSSFSSPGHPHNDGPLNYDNSHMLHPQTYSSPIRPVRESSFRPYSTVPQPFLRQTTKKGFVPLFPKPFDMKILRGIIPPPIINIKDHSDHSEESVGNYVFQANKTPESISPTTSKPRHPTKSLNKPQRIERPPPRLFPSPSLTSPSTSNYLTKRQIPDNSSPGLTDAYRHPIEDPDEEWTTFRSKKKRKRQPKSSTYPKSFYIPGLKTETNATLVTRRVAVYLPPPKSVDVGCPTNSEYNRTGPSMKGTEDRNYIAPSSPTNFDTDAYPSPSTSSSKLLPSSNSQARRARNCTPPSRPGTSYRPPSPPTSDLPIPSDGLDAHLEVDYEGIQRRYPKMKQLLRKRKQASSEVWNMLGLDSCGYVYKDSDVDRDQQGEQMEIQIVKWSGLPPP